MGELLCQEEDGGGGGGDAGGWHRARVEDAMWWSEKGQNIWPESINEEQQKAKHLLVLYMLHMLLDGYF